MIDAFVDVVEQFPRGLIYVVMGVALLAIGRLAQDVVTPYKIQEQLRDKDNVALALSITGYYLGIVIVFLGAVYQPSTLTADAVFNLGFTTEYWEDVLRVLVYSLVGIVVLNVARIVVDKLVLYMDLGSGPTKMRTTKKMKRSKKIYGTNTKNKLKN